MTEIHCTHHAPTHKAAWLAHLAENPGGQEKPDYDLEYPKYLCVGHGVAN